MTIQETGLSLISEGRLLDLKLLLQQEFLVPLQPLLLLLGWDRYRDVGSGQKLLDCLWPRGQRKEVQCYAFLCVCIECVLCKNALLIFQAIFFV